MGKRKAMDRLTRNRFISDMQLLRSNGNGPRAGRDGDMREDDDPDWDNPDPGKNLMISLRMTSDAVKPHGLLRALALPGGGPHEPVPPDAAKPR